MQEKGRGQRRIEMLRLRAQSELTEAVLHHQASQKAGKRGPSRHRAQHQQLHDGRRTREEETPGMKLTDGREEPPIECSEESSQHSAKAAAI